MNIKDNITLAQASKSTFNLIGFIHPKALLGLLSMSLIALPACQMRKYVERTHKHVEEKYESTRAWDTLPQRSITWNQALKLIDDNNMQLRQASTAIESSERETHSVYTDLIPGVSFYGNMTQSLRELSDLGGSKDISNNVNVNFYLPTLTRLPYEVYSAEAKLYAATKAKEGKKREISSKLYELIRQREVSNKIKQLENSDPDKAALTTSDKLNDYNLDSKYWQQIASILGNRDARWKILPASIPYIKWREYEKKLETLDPLRLNIYAMKIEEARLRQYGIALEYLPTINIGLYSPSLFSSTGGTYSGTFLDSDDTTVNMSISSRLDTKLDTWNRYKTNKENFDSICHEVVGELIEHRSKLRMLKHSFKEYESWKSYMNKKITYIHTEPVYTAADYNKKMKAIRAMKRELLTQENSSITSEAALMLEYGINNN